MAELSQEEVNGLRVSMQKHFDTRLEAYEKLVTTRMTAIEKQIATQDKVIEARLALLNEFRDAMRDQTGTLLPINEFKSWKDRVEKEITYLREVISLYLTLKEHEVWKTKIEADIHTLQLFRAVIDAKASMGMVYVSYIFNAVSIAIALFGVAHTLMAR